MLLRRYQMYNIYIVLSLTWCNVCVHNNMLLLNLYNIYRVVCIVQELQDYIIILQERLVSVPNH